MTKQTIVVVILSIAFLISCNSTKKSSDKQESKKEKIQLVENQEYIITKINGLDKISKNPTLKLNLKTKNISGSTSCNTYGGNIIIDGNNIKIERLMATKRYCSELKDIENTFTKNLSLAKRYELKDSQILFYDKADVLLLVGEKKVNQ